jgi:hypothetical protein
MAHALSDLVKNIRRFYKLNTTRKALEKEEQALKSFFKKEAAGSERRFIDEGKGIEVLVSFEPRTGIDLDKLRIELKEGIQAYETSSTVEKVTVKEFKVAKTKSPT